MTALDTGPTVAGVVLVASTYCIWVSSDTTATTADCTLYLPSYSCWGSNCAPDVVDLERPGPAVPCARAGCRREAIARGFYGGALRDLCQLCKAVADRRGGRRCGRHEVQQRLVLARRRVRHVRGEGRAGGDQRLLHELRRLPEEGRRGAGREVGRRARPRRRRRK